MPASPIPRENLHLVRNALRDLPRPDVLAETLLSAWLKDRGIDTRPADIEVITIHYQREPLGEGRAHFRENARLIQAIGLVEALLGNWQGEPTAGLLTTHQGDWAGNPPLGPLTLVERLAPQDPFSNAAPYQVFNGLYRRTQPARYAPDTRLPIRAEDFQRYVEGQHLKRRYKAQLDTYWAGRQEHYRRALRIALIAACNRQAWHGSLSAPARRLAWQAAGLLPRGDVRVSRLNVYGYLSTSIVRIQSPSRVLLYIPGNSAPLHEFDDETAMKRWFAEQCQTPLKRDALLQHFARADWPDGLEFSGLRTALEGLGLYPRAHRLSPGHPGFARSGHWDPQAIVDFRAERYSPPIDDDLFSHLTQCQKARSYADADRQITSNSEVLKAHVSHYLDGVTSLLLPLLVVLPELIPLLAIGGVAQFSLGLDQALHGKTLAAKAEGVGEQVFGLFNAVSAATSLLARPEAVFRYARPGFFTSRRLASLLGAPRGGAGPVEELALQPAELAFREQPRISPTTTAALVARVDDSLQHRFIAWLQSDDAGIVTEWVEYELASDSFIRSADAKLRNPPRWVIADEQAQALTPAGLPRQASDAQREGTLQALGIDLRLPLDTARYAQLPRTPIPKVISSVWLGNRPLQGEFLDALAANVRVVEGSGYRYQIFLSRQDPAVYQHNLRALRLKARDALLMPLEDQAFFHEFSLTPYFPQYQAAIEGNRGVASNFASACDILRYRLLRHYGGLYLDADDRLLGATFAHPVAPLASKTLKTTSDGLLLSPPVSNDQLGMYLQFNSSMIGSHPGNPTLDAVSDEILRRYGQAPGYYDSRPDPVMQPVLFQQYARRLNRLTGPGVLNDVIDQRLPWLRQLRETCKLIASPVRDVNMAVDLKLFSRLLRDQVPLGDIAAMGEAHSWAQPGRSTVVA